MIYKNLDIWIDKKNEDRYPLRALSDFGFGEIREYLNLARHTAKIEEMRSKLARRETNRELLIDFGSLLYQALFKAGKGQLEELFQRCWGKTVDQADQGIRIRLRIEAPEVSVLPWEFLYSPTRECFLGASIHTPLVRYLEIFEPIREFTTKLPIRMLVVIPESSGLDTEKEKENLRLALDGMGKWVELVPLDRNVTRTKISDALMKERFHILHFIGHGDFQEDNAYLQLNTAEGQPEYIDQAKFSSLFLNHPTMKLVVLNSCKGAEISSSDAMVGMAPQLVQRGIPAVVAMQYSIYDDVAVLFAREFYRPLFRGWASGWVEVAVSHARNRLASEFPKERAVGTPVLFLRATEGVLFNPVTGKRLRDTPFSKKEVDRSNAVAKTHEENISWLQKKQKKSPDARNEEELTKENDDLIRLKQRLKFRRASLITAICVSFFMFFLSWLQMFESLPPALRIETYTVWLGDLFVKKTFDERIAMVAIDDQTKEAIRETFDRSWRREHGILVDKLSKAGAKVIAFDLYFPQPSDYDEEFSESIRRAKKRETAVILGVRSIKDEKPELVETLRTSVSDWGLLCIGRKWRSAHIAPLINKKDNGLLVPSLSMAAVAAFNESRVIAVDFHAKQLTQLKQEQQILTLPFSEVDEVRKPQRGCSAIGEGDRLANIIIDLSALDALRKKRYPYSKIIRPPTPDYLAQFKGKIVLVGLETDDDDVFPTFRGLGMEMRYGLQLHADAVNTLLKGVAIRPFQQKWQFTVIVCMGMLGALIVFCLPQTHWIWRASCLLAVLTIYLAAAVYIYSRYHLLLNTVYQVGALWFTYWAVGKIKKRWFA